jgi:ABC-2 type transport system permease protein
MMRAVRAEWVKAFSDPAFAWLLAALAGATAAVSVVCVTASHCPAAGCGQDPGRISLTGVYLGQAVAALAGVLAVGGEYGTGMIGVTLAAVPRRGRLLAAKAIALGGPVLAASVLAVGASVLAGLLILPGHGFTSARGFDLAGAGTARASLCAAADLTLTALLGLGVAAAVRDSAVAVGVTLSLLYLFPVAAGLVAAPAAQRFLEQAGPLPAALDSMTTTGLPALPLGPWPGLGVVAAWAAGALAIGGAVLVRRDA